MSKANLTNKSPARQSWRDVLPVHPAAELFPLMDADELRALGEDIRANGLQQAVIILSNSNGDELLLDGRNRLDAMARVGIKFDLKRYQPGWWKLDIFEDGVPTVNCDLADTIDESVDPYDYVIGANIHRRHLNAKDKRDLIAKVLKAKPDRSNLQIAREVKVTDKTVAKVRAGLKSRSEIPNVETRTDSKGRKQKARKPPPLTPAPEKDPVTVTETPEASAEQRKALYAALDKDDPEPSTPTPDKPDTADKKSATALAEFKFACTRYLPMMSPADRQKAFSIVVELMGATEAEAAIESVPAAYTRH